MSVTGLCVYCGTEIMLESNRQIAAREGPYYERWLAGFQAAIDKRRNELASAATDDAS